MKYKLAIVVGLVALLGLLGVTIAEMRTDAMESEIDTTSEESVLIDSNDADGNARSIVPVQPTYRDYDGKPARGLKIRPDGVTVGRIFYIDRNSLTLLPVANARIGLLQNRRIVAQSITNEQGVFTVDGLTPWGVYSVTAASEQWVSVFSAVIIPVNDSIPENDLDLQALGQSDQNQDRWINDIRLVAADAADDENGEESPSNELAGNEFFAEDMDPESPQTAQPQAELLDRGELQEFDAQAIPRENFIVALRAGLFGTDVSGLPPAMVDPSGGMVGGTGRGGGGGGAGGGAGGLGGALLGAGIGAAVGAAAGSDSATPASPFQP